VSSGAATEQATTSQNAPRVHAFWKVSFALYVLMIATATHWPQLKIDAPGRPDLWIHLTVFMLWTSLLAMLSLFGPRWSTANIGMCAIVTLAYAAIDESTQHFVPGRTPTLEDYGANAGGVLLGSMVLLLIARWQQRKQKTAASR
jgi:VanZ family protein